jgi:hypothetical protein
MNILNKEIIACAAHLDATATTTETESLYEALSLKLKQRYSYNDMVRSAKQLPPEIGTFKAGRRGHPSRIDWAAPVGSLCGHDFTEQESSALGGIDAEPQNEAESPVKTPHCVVSGAEAMIEHPFALRPGLRVTLSLPADLTQIEAERLATFLRSLPFNSVSQ